MQVEDWCGELPRWSKALQTWGEAEVVKVKTQTMPKSSNKGTTCMFVGYATNHADGVYIMWNSTTNRVHVSQDITWLKQVFYEKKVEEPEISIVITPEARESGVPDNSKNELHPPADNNEDDAPEPVDGKTTEVTTEELLGNDDNSDARNIAEMPAFKEAKEAN
eukprot:10473021-Ditylum_brightwellii.AAC.1